MTRRRIAVGQEIQMAFAETDATGFMVRIGGEVRTVRVLDGSVQILDEDLAGITYRPLFEHVGIHRDRRGLYVEPAPRLLTVVLRHGKRVSVPMTRDIHAIRWLESRTPWYAERCLAREGYEIGHITNRSA